MNNSSTAGLLQKLNDEKATALIPAMIFIGILMLIGFTGNICAFYFYGCKTKTTATSCYILCVSIFDLLSCIISMPIEIVDMRFFYMFPDVTICKVLTATNFIFTISSGRILIAIAIERYRRICLPFRKQLTVFQARLICFISVLIACVFSWPSLVFYTVVSVDVPIPGSGVIQGYDCTAIKDNSLKVYLNVFNVLQILLFIFTVLPLTVLYVLVYRQLNKMKQFQTYALKEARISPKSSGGLGIGNSSTEKSNKNNKKTKRFLNNTEVSACKNFEKPVDSPNMANNFLTKVTSKRKATTKETALVGDDSNKVREHNRADNDESMIYIELEQNNGLSEQNEHTDSLELGKNVIIKVPDHNSGMFNNDKVTGEGGQIKLGSAYSLQKRRATDLNSVRYTTIMLVITITFVLSFLPYLCLVVWSTLSTGYVANKMTDVQLIFYAIFIRSYFLNSVLNPIIYGYFNSEFRMFVTSVCCLWYGSKYCCMRDPKQETC